MSPLLLRRLSDEQLGSRLALGEAAAFDELYRRYVHRLSAYGANLIGDRASGDDVAQSALLKAYGALRDGRVPDRVKPWLYRIAHNVAIDLVARRRELPSAELPEGSTGGREIVERSGALVAALASLPERQRRVYALRELHGLRIDETAAELGLSTSQVEQSLFAARNRLAEHLVFGDRLNCIAVQRLASGPLDRTERRALKTHLRSCPACRSELGLRGRALSGLPVAPLDWLRGLLAGVATGGAPVAAKVGAVVATATFAVGVPAALDQASHHPRPLLAHPRLSSTDGRRATPTLPARAVTHSTARPVGVPIRLTVARPVSAPSARRAEAHDAREPSHRHSTATHRTGGEGGGDSGSGSGPGSDGGGGTVAPALAASPPTAPVTVTDGGGDGGGGGGGGTQAPAAMPSSSPGQDSSASPDGGGGQDAVSGDGSTSGGGDGSSNSGDGSSSPSGDSSDG